MGFFLFFSSSLFLFMQFGFDGWWPDLYFRSIFRTENKILYFQAAVTKDETWKPSYFESSGDNCALLN
jgi:hypothetical protein